MPNPRAQRPLSLQAVTEDIRSLAQPAEALMDMLAGAAKGSVTATAGIGGDLESLARGIAAAYRAPSGQRMDAFAGGMDQPTVLPTTQDISAKLPAVVPTTAPLSRQHTAEYGQGMGEFIPTPGSGKVVKGGLSMAGQALNDRLLAGQSLTPFLNTPAPITHVIKPQRGQFHADTITSVDRVANKLTPAVPKVATARLNNLRAALASAEDSLPNSSTVKNLREEVTEMERINALNDWVLNNVQNYMKRDMGSPNDPIRKLYDARAKQGEKLEADFHKKMKALETKVNEIEAGPQTDDSRRALVYLKNAMEDEVVKLQTEKEYLGITHRYGGKPFDLPESDEYKRLIRRRLDAGFPGMGMAESDIGRAWEAAADQAIQTTPAGDINRSKQVFDELTALEKQINDRRSKISNDFYEKFIVPSLDDQKKANALNRMDPFLKEELLGEKGQLEALMNQHTEILKKNPNVSLNFDVAQRNPWVSKLEPQEPVYGVYPNYVDLEHVIDVLEADLKAGRIKPEQLNKVSMDQAVARTIEHETDKARKLAEEATNLQKHFPVHKEYPEGYKWIELKMPSGATELPPGYRAEPYKGKFSEGVQILDQYGKQVSAGDNFEDALKNLNLGQLERALADEGKRMGHCVGQYCDDVASGETRIFSLRDRRGTPHATIEVKSMSPEDMYYKLPERDRVGIGLIAQRIADEQGIGYYEALDKYIKENVPSGGDRVLQIKGKGNKEVAEKYWPYAQDFVRSGDYQEVNDLVNAGLNWKLSNLFDPEQVEKLKAAGHETPRFLNDQERNNLIERLYEIETGNNMETGKPLKAKSDPLENLFDDIDDINPPQGMKRGGKVSLSDNCDCMHMELDGKKMASGGKVSLSDNPDTQMMELANGGEVRMQDGGDPSKKKAAEQLWEELRASIPQDSGLSPIDTLKQNLSAIYEGAKKVPGNLYNLATNPVEYVKNLPAPTGEQIINAFSPADMGFVGSFKPHTPKKPDPTVGTRYKVTDQGGLAPRKDLNIESLQNSQVKIFPWDATSRNKLVTEVSDVPLTKHVLTEGGDDYMRDLQHINQRIAGASNLGISKRIMDRINEASVENQLLGNGTGRVFGFPVRMGENAENAATFPTDIGLDLMKQAGLSKKDLNAFDENMRNMVFEGKKGVFKDMAKVGTPEFEYQLRHGLKSDKEKGIQGFTDMNMRKAFMNRLGLVGNQEKIGFNIQDLTGSVLAEELKGVPKGYVGNVAAELDVFGKLRPSKSSTYDTDFPGVYAGSMPNMPVEFLMPNTFENIYKEMRLMYPNQTPDALRNMTIGAMEKRKQNISEKIGQRNIDAVKTYQEGLLKGEFDPNNINEVYDYMRRKKMGLKNIKKAAGGETQKANGGEVHGLSSQDLLYLQNQPDIAKISPQAQREYITNMGGKELRQRMMLKKAEGGKITSNELIKVQRKRKFKD